MQLSPARGRLLTQSPLFSKGSTMQLSPARGRLPTGVRLGGTGVLDAAYPREGTVTRPVLITFSNQMGCSLSPRGDGYASLPDTFSAYSLMQLIPARGRLRNIARLTMPLNRCSLSPRGDGYQNSRVSCPSIGDAAYPREGTVTEFVAS